MDYNVKITQQTFYDLSTWLTHPNKYSQDQLSRLLNEEKYLPLITLAHEYWLVGALTNQLKSANVWNKLSSEFKSYLIEVEGIYSHRINAIKSEAVDVTSLLVDANIDVVVMKGAASLFNGVAGNVSNRYMKDIDILVPEKQQQAAYSVLKKHGYNKDKDYYDVNACDTHHSPPLLKNNLCYIELHRWVLIKHLNKILDTKIVWEQAVPLTLTSNLKVKQLSPNHQIILSIAHSEIQNGGYDQKHIDFHQLFNLFSIANYYAEEVDWGMVKQYFHKSDQLPILKATLYTLLRLFEFQTPITDNSCIVAIKHFDSCLARYVKNQGVHSYRSVLMEQLHGYKKRNIYLMYGNNDLFSYSKGVIRHLYYHLRKASSLQHVKPYLSRMLNKRGEG